MLLQINNIGKEWGARVNGKGVPWKKERPNGVAGGSRGAGSERTGIGDRSEEGVAAVSNRVSSYSIQIRRTSPDIDRASYSAGRRTRG